MTRFIRRPQTVWIRRVNLQVHLWLGLPLSIYLIIIGLTGSVLVFRQELESLTEHHPWPARQATPPFADVADVVQNIRGVYGQSHLVSITMPTAAQNVFLATLLDHRGRLYVACDPAAGRILGEYTRQTTWVDQVQNLHITLLLGPRGRVLNGVGGALLLLINITGLVVWWPGIRHWKRALGVDFRRRWRRINLDLHSAVGFWTLAIVSFWALSGIYFGWPRQVFAAVNSLSPIVSARPPVVRLNPVEEPLPLNLRAILNRASALDPNATLAEVAFPYSRRAPLEVLMSRDNRTGREYTDTLYFSPWDGSFVQMWRYGVNKTLGDWLIWAQVPLHYGTYWGLGVKILWASFGLALPLLTITGAILYWNRVLRHLAARNRNHVRS